MRCKLKLLLGLYQCLTAVPSVFGVSVPDDARQYRRALDTFDLMANLGVSVVIPGSVGETGQSKLPPHLPCTRASCHCGVALMLC